MPDIEKVIKGLESHANDCCETDKGEVCPYWSDAHCSSKLSADARALLQEQLEERRNFFKEYRSIYKK